MIGEASGSDTPSYGEIKKPGQMARFHKIYICKND